MGSHLGEKKSRPDYVTEVEKLFTSIEHAGDFAANGIEERFSLPGLNVEGVGPLSLPLPPSQAAQLKAVASQAPFGRGEETVVDTTVRNALQLHPDQFQIKSPGWEGVVKRIKAKACTELGVVPAAATTSLYKLLLYEPGSFFLPHRDTEKEDRMFATLVIVLPSIYEGGELCVEQADQTKTFDHSGKEYAVCWAAFYADCRHGVTPIASGHRLCLIYNLVQKEGTPALQAPYDYHMSKVQQLMELVRQWQEDKGGPEKLILQLQHKYSPDGIKPGLTALKGRDRAWGATLTLAQQQGLVASLATLSIDEAGFSEDRWPDSFNVQESDRKLQDWRNLNESQGVFGTVSVELKDEVIPSLTEGDLMDSNFKWCSEEITRNCRDETEFYRQYKRVCLVIFPKQYMNKMLAMHKISSAVDILKKNLAESAQDLSNDPPDLLKCMIRHLIKHRWAREKGSVPHDAIASLLIRVGHKGLAFSYALKVLLSILLDSYSEQKTWPQDAFAALSCFLGWKCMDDAIFMACAHMVGKGRLRSAVSFLRALHGTATGSAASSEAVTLILRKNVEAILQRLRNHRVKPKESLGSMWEDRSGLPEATDMAFLKRLFTVLHDLGRKGSASLQSFVDILQSRADMYPPNVLCKLCLELPEPQKGNGMTGSPHFARLVRHCGSALKAAISAGPPAEPNWARSAPGQHSQKPCTCAVCLPLVDFLKDASMRECRIELVRNEYGSLGLPWRHAPKLPYDVDYTLEYDPPKAASNEDEGSCAQTSCAREGTGTLRFGARSRAYGHDMHLPDKDSSAIALKLVKTCEKHEAAQARYKGLFKALQSLQPLLQELADDAENDRGLANAVKGQEVKEAVKGRKRPRQSRAASNT